MDTPRETPLRTLPAAFAEGESEVRGGDRAFLLAGRGAWLVVAGHVDVFSIRLEGGAPAGARTHVARVCAQQALFGLGAVPDEGYFLLGVGGGPAKLRHISDVVIDGELEPLALGWVETLYKNLTRDRLPAVSLELAPGQDIEVPTSASVRAGTPVVWLELLAGSARLLGRAGLEIDAPGPVPLAGQAWISAEGPASVRGLAAGALSPDHRARGLDALHALVLRHATLAASDAEQSALDRLRARATLRQGILHDACERLAATMARRDSDTPDVQDLADPLFAACVKVGAAQDFPMQSYPRTADLPLPRDPLAAILRASRIRSRRVALRGEWWKEEGGALLAFRSEGRLPVALLWSGGGYVLHDPRDSSEMPVGAALAESIEPFAHSFYRPFPERALGIPDVVRFAVHRSGRDLMVVAGLALAGALLGMVPSMATGMLFNTIIPGAQRSQLLQMTLVLVACALTGALFSLANGYVLIRIESRAGAALQAAVWDRLLAVPLPFFRTYTSGELASRAMSVDAIRQVVSGATISAFIGLVMAGGNFFLMYWYSASLALWGTGIIAVVLCITLAGSYWQLRPQRAAVQIQSKLSGLVLQLLGGVAKLRVASAEVHAFALWVRHFAEQRRVIYASRSVSNWLSAVNAAVPLLANLLLFYLALPLVTEAREMQTGDFLAFLAAFASCNGSVVGSSLAMLATINTLPLYEQAKPILETLPEVDRAKSDPGVLTGDIEVHHAVFRYRPDDPLVLRDVSFHIRSGEFCAFVGPSGSGKSTLLRLLLGFEALEAGSIYLDGQEIRGLDIQAVRRQMGVVLQTGRLMSGELYMNIVGASGASLDEAWEAAAMAGLADDIRAMPMGMHTVVSEGGSTLSGGQRQRLLIARAVVNRPRILLFDEATSALDNRTQAIVSASLESLQATRIVVAHRLSTILNADRIFVIVKGQVVESGRYSDLMAQGGVFAELAKRQLA